MRHEGTPVSGGMALSGLVGKEQTPSGDGLSSFRPHPLLFHSCTRRSATSGAHGLQCIDKQINYQYYNRILLHGFWCDGYYGHSFTDLSASSCLFPFTCKVIIFQPDRLPELAYCTSTYMLATTQIACRENKCYKPKFILVCSVMKLRLKYSILQTQNKHCSISIAKLIFIALYNILVV